MQQVEVVLRERGGWCGERMLGERQCVLLALPVVPPRSGVAQIIIVT